MPNIKFNYLYRDGANYKNYGFIIFSNPTNIATENLLNLINSKLIEEAWFYADQWKLPDMNYEKWNNEFDHTYHEFESIEHTNETPDSEFTLSEFIKAVSSSR